MTLYFGVGQKKSINVGRFSIEIRHKVSKPLAMRTKAIQDLFEMFENVLISIYIFLFAQKYTK